MRRDLDRIVAIVENKEQQTLPSTWRYSPKLLGIIPESRRPFPEHPKEMRSQAFRGLSVLGRAGNSSCVLVGRALRITTYARLERSVSFGLAMTGAHASVADSRETDAGVLAKAARRVGVGATIRKEIQYTLADAKPTANHFALKSASVLDRVPRAKNSTARGNAAKFVRNLYHLNCHDLLDVHYHYSRLALTSL